MTRMQFTEYLTVCCGRDVVSWNPKADGLHSEHFRLQHKVQVWAAAWAVVPKVLAFCCDEGVVSLYSPRDGHVVSTVPRRQLLPASPAPVTALCTSEKNVLYGTAAGAVMFGNIVGGCEVTTLHEESGHGIAALVVPSKQQLVAASKNGNVIHLRWDAKRSHRASYFLCKDNNPRCSLAASHVDSSVACGSVRGTINVWDASTGLAKHHLQDEDSATHVAFQAYTSTVLLSTTSGIKSNLRVWDVRSGQMSQSVALHKGATCIAAHPSAAHCVAVGDAAGVTWTYDLRHADAPLRRLPSEGRAPVTSLDWSAKNVHNTSPGSRRPSATATSSQAPSRRAHAHGFTAPPSDTGATSPASSVPPVGTPQARTSAEHSGHGAPDASPAFFASTSTRAEGPNSKSPEDAFAFSRPGEGQYAPASQYTAPDRSQPLDSSRAASSIPAGSRRNGRPATHATHDPAGSVTLPPPRSGHAATSPVPLGDLQAAVRTAVAPLQTALMELQAASATAAAAAAAAAAPPERPAYNTQLVRDHVDGAVGKLREEMQAFHLDTIRQFHLAQLDLLEVSRELSKQIGNLNSNVQALSAQLEEDRTLVRQARNLI